MASPAPVIHRAATAATIATADAMVTGADGGVID